MTYSHPTFRSLLARFSGALGLLALGLGTACTYTDYGGYGDRSAECHDEWSDCMDDADSPAEINACNDDKDSCLAECDDDGWGHGDDGHGDHGDDGDDDGRAPHSDDDGANDDGAGDDGAGDDGGTPTDDGGTPTDDGGNSSDDGGADTGDTPDLTCFEIHSTCVSRATTVAEVDACEALFDQCLDAEQCDESCDHPICPDPEVNACLDVYAACTAKATTPDVVSACGAAFDACVDGIDDSACVPHDPEVVDACLEQHALCTSCIDGPEDLWVCQEVFDSCVAA